MTTWTPVAALTAAWTSLLRIFGSSADSTQIRADSTQITVDATSSGQTTTWTSVL